MNPDSIPNASRIAHGSSTDDDVIDLSANINPAIPAGTRHVYQTAFDSAQSYPDDDYPRFRDTAAAITHSNPQQIIPTGGGLAALRLVIAAVVSPDDTVLIPTPAFGEYAREVQLAGGTPRFVSHQDLLDQEPGDHALAVVCTPNNPTGHLYERNALVTYAERCADVGTIFLVDEAFLGFTDQASLTGQPGVAVIRSLTKMYGLPGIRAGYVVADGALRDRLAIARPPWSLGEPAAAIGSHVMRDNEFREETRERVARERAYLREGLEAYGFDIHPSTAPFVLCNIGEDPDDLLAACRDRGIVLRDATTFRGLETHIRIAVRNRESTEKLLAVLEEVT